ncbi:MAG: biosynthetic-type acetolactate synthase large subunit [Acutalibacteraceae bacterium]
MKIRGAKILVECLLEQGVDTVFGYPGGAVLNIYDELYLYQDKIKHYLTCHEQAAAHAADGYSRASGKTGVCIATSGPGATNLVTGIATAYMDSIPMVAITGNVGVNLLGKDSFQEVDITGITMPITKHNFIVKRVEELADTVRKAFYIARSGRPGPVLIDIPKDVTANLCEYERAVPEKSQKNTKLSKSALEKAAKAVNKAKKPYIFAGGGVLAAGADRLLKEFADKIDAPVGLSMMGIGAFPPEDEKFTGMVGMHGTKTSALCVDKCDLLIAIGTRFSDRVATNPKGFAKNAEILHIDIDPAEINKNVAADYHIIGDVEVVLKELLPLVEAKKNPEWIEQVAAWKKEYPVKAKKDEWVLPKSIMEALSEIGKDDVIITTEVGQNQIWAAQYCKISKPGMFLTSGGLGTMGYGFGAAIGAAAATGKVCVNVAGDGCFHMNMNELATAVSYDLPVIILLMNNNVLGMVRQWQKIFYGKRFSYTTLNRPTDYEALAKAFKADAYTIRTESDIYPVLTEAISKRRPCVINCVINQDQNVLPMIAAGDDYENIMMDIKD